MAGAGCRGPGGVIKRSSGGPEPVPGVQVLGVSSPPWRLGVELPTTTATTTNTEATRKRHSAYSLWQKPSILLILASCLILLVHSTGAHNLPANNATSLLDRAAAKQQEPATTPKANQEDQDTSSTEEPEVACSKSDCSDQLHQDERPSAEHDDDDAESCPGLSADATAKAANLSDTQRLVNLQSCLQKKINRKLRQSTRDSMELFDKLSLTGGCSASLMSLMASLGQLKSYAFKFFDASAKIPSGMLYGLLSDFGDFDQCLSIRSDPAVTLDMEPEERAFSGKYCLLDFHMNYHIKLAPNESVPEGIQPDGILWDELVRHYWTSNSPKGFQIGMCFPSKCTDDDLEQIWSSLGESYNFKGRILQCQDGFDLRNQHATDGVQRSILYVFYTFLVLSLIGTLVNRYGNELLAHRCQLTYSLLTCFSLARSWTIFTSLSPRNQHTCESKCGATSEQGLANGQPPESTETKPLEHQTTKSHLSHLSHLSGLRLFVILWVTMGHSFLYPSASNYQHYRSIINMNLTRDSVWFATTNFTLGIDMLLYMAGLVFVFKFASEARPNKGTSRIWCLLAEKIFRFWPTYFAVIALAIVVPLAGDGPMWPEMISKRIGASCRRSWWANLLFVNNFQRESEICLPSSWFVSVLMQLFLIGSVILILEHRYSTRAALLTLATLLLASCAYSFSHALHFRVSAPVIRMDESFVMEMDEDIWHLYTNPLNNLGPFLVGMLGGYLLLHVTRPASTTTAATGNLKPSKHTVSGWLGELVYAGLFAGIAALVLSSVFYKSYSPLGSSVYWAFHRVGWALATGYLVHKCATGSWRLLKDLLSLSSFIPVSRLIFVAYLVYPIFIHMHSGLVRDGLHVSIYNMFNVYITRLVLTFSTALIIHLLFEIPLRSLEELVYRNLWLSSSSSDPSTSTQQSGNYAKNKKIEKEQQQRRKSSTTGVLLKTLGDSLGGQTTSVVALERA